MVDLESIRERNVQSNTNRTTWRRILLVAFILSAVTAVVFFAVYRYRQSDDYAKYTEKGYASYNVVLSENYNPYGDKVPGSNMQYLSSKVEGLHANLYYKLNMQEGDVEYKYTYTLKEVVQVSSKETGKTIISYQNEIKKKTINAVKADELTIEESHYLDYMYHDTKITQFINQQSDLRTHSVVSTLKLVLEINLKGVCQDFEDEFSKHPTVYISVPLTTDTVSISSGSNITKGEGRVVLCNNLGNDKPFLITSYVFIVISVLLIVAWYVYGKLTMSQDDKFVKTTNKIQANYGSYIQQINQPISQNYQQVVEFTKFVDLLEVSNIIKQPVFIEKKTDDQTVYVVPESSTRIYMFRLNKESFAKKENSAKSKKEYKSKKIEEKQQKVEKKKQLNIQEKTEEKAQSLESVDASEQSKQNQSPKNEKVEKPIKIKKEKPKKAKKEKPAKKANSKKVKESAEISSVDKSVIKKTTVAKETNKQNDKKVDKEFKSTINKVKKPTISKRQARKHEIFKIIEDDLQNIDSKRNGKPTQKTTEYKSSDKKH